MKHTEQFAVQTWKFFPAHVKLEIYGSLPVSAVMCFVHLIQLSLKKSVEHPRPLQRNEKSDKVEQGLYSSPEVAALQTASAAAQEEQVGILQLGCEVLVLAGAHCSGCYSIVSQKEK